MYRSLCKLVVKNVGQTETWDEQFEINHKNETDPSPELKKVVELYNTQEKHQYGEEATLREFVSCEILHSTDDEVDDGSDLEPSDLEDDEEEEIDSDLDDPEEEDDYVEDESYLE